MVERRREKGRREKGETENRMERWKEGARQGRKGEREGGREIRRTGVSQTQVVPEPFFATHVFIALGLPLETENKTHRRWRAEPVTEGRDQQQS